MTRIRHGLALAALVASLAVPAVALAGDGTGSAPATGARGAHAVRVLERISNRLDRRFKAFSSHCLVQNAPEKCTRAADHLVKHLGKLSAGLQKLEDRIKQKCAAADAPKRCANAGQVTQAIDDLRAKIASETSAIKAAFPNAGGS